MIRPGRKPSDPTDMVKIFTKMAAVGLVCFFFTVLTLSVLPKSPPDWVVLAVLIAVNCRDLLNAMEECRHHYRWHLAVPQIIKVST